MAISGMDALHVACAEKAKVDFFVTCDDRLTSKLKKMPDLKVSCCSLLEFVSQEVFT
jgi:predicted nucleic acid-binding protein